MAVSDASPAAKSGFSHVDLVPWDPESPEHVERMVQQRIACGWKSEAVEKWKPWQREGRIALQWVVLPLVVECIVASSDLHRSCQMPTQNLKKG